MTCNLMFFPLYFWRNCLIFKSSYLGCCNALMPWNLMLVMSRWWSKHWLNWMVEHRLSKGNCCIETFLSTYDRLVLARIYPSKNILYLFFLSVHFLVSPLLVRILGSSSNPIRLLHLSSSSYCPVLSLYMGLPSLCASGSPYAQTVLVGLRRVVILYPHATRLWQQRGTANSGCVISPYLWLVSRGTYHICSGHKSYINMFQEAWVQPSPLQNV
jgi:hypothetical protein